MRNFRDIDKREEILGLLKRAPDSNRGEIWQTLPDARHHYKIITIRDDAANKAIVFESNEKFEFSAKYPIYVRINYRDLIFKLTARSFVVSGNRIASVYPNFAKAVDNRGVERVPLPPDRDIKIVLGPMGAGAAELAVKLVDISKKGLGITISEMNRDYLQRNKNFKLISINDLRLPGDHQLELRYVERIGKGSIRSGLKLATPFTDPTYDLVCKMIFGS